jgi:hypothetical protein
MPWVRKGEYQKLREIEQCLELVKTGVIRNHYVSGEDRVSFRFGARGREAGVACLSAFRRAFDLVNGQYFATFIDGNQEGSLPAGSLLYQFKDPETGKTIVPPPEVIQQFIRGLEDGIEQAKTEIEVMKTLMEGDLVGEEL